MFQTVETDLKSSKDGCLIFPNSTCDEKFQSSPMSIQSETIKSGSMVNLIISISSTSMTEYVVSLCKTETSKISLKPL